MRVQHALAAAAFLATTAFSAPSVNANWTMGNDYMVLVINNSSYTVYELYATNVDNPDWGDDLIWLFGIGPIYPGQSVWIDMDDYSGYCYYDFLAVGSNGVEWEDYNANVCARDSWRLTN